MTGLEGTPATTEGQFSVKTMRPTAPTDLGALMSLRVGPRGSRYVVSLSALGMPDGPNSESGFGRISR